MKYLVCFIFNFLLFVSTVYSVTLVPIQSSVVFEIKKPFEIACNVTGEDAAKVEVKWKKDEITISGNPRYVQKKDDKDPNLAILKVGQAEENDAGNYTCVVDNVEGDAIKVTSKIHVRIPTNINVVEGEKLRIHCQVVGYPHPELHWKYQNDTYEHQYKVSEGRVILEEDEEKHIPAAVLIVEEIEMFDRGEFTCIGESSSGETVSAKSMIRVKDKYAALWPFIGIVLEVVILCVIIFIYEKKHNKAELEESDTDQSPDQKNTPDHDKDSNLRHRQ